jgi:hypothetical protein
MLSEDMSEVQPYLWDDVHADGRSLSVPDVGLDPRDVQTRSEPDDDGEDLSIQQDISIIRRLLDVLKRDMQSRRGLQSDNSFTNITLAHGADLMVQVPSGSCFPVHRTVLGARCQALCDVLSGGKMIQDEKSSIFIRLNHNSTSSAPVSGLLFSGCHPISVLILFVYFYSDELPAIWDRRVALALEEEVSSLKIIPEQVKHELRALTRLLCLPVVSSALASPVKRTPASSLARDMSRFFQHMQTSGIPQTSPLLPDVVLRLADKDVMCHSVILRARSPFFAGFFGDEVWTVKRRDVNRTVQIDLRHLNWREMRFVLRFLCCGDEMDMFETLGRVSFSVPVGRRMTLLCRLH